MVESEEADAGIGVCFVRITTQRMNNNTTSRLGWVFWGLIGLFLLYVFGRFLLTEYELGKYEKIFSQVEHPSGTSLVDHVSLRFSYYPATYADDSIHFKSANLVGELRSYGGNWDEIKDFYGSHTLENGKLIAVIPIEIHKNDEDVWLDIPDWFLSSPGHHDILEGIREQYDFWGWPESLNATAQGLYLVYALWQ